MAPRKAQWDHGPLARFHTSALKGRALESDQKWHLGMLANDIASSPQQIADFYGLGLSTIEKYSKAYRNKISLQSGKRRTSKHHIRTANIGG